MAVKFQYNKTALQELNRQLRIRQKALPTLKNKEAALRVEVKKARYAAEEREAKLQEQMQTYRSMVRLWEEFDADLLRVEEVRMNQRKIAGVKIPLLDEIEFNIQAFSRFNQPPWFADGIALLKELAYTAVEKEILLRTMKLLDYARKKTTQKVNLYEKVQIPDYESAILKIKRYLEDQENLAKAAQKIVKKRKEAANQNG